MSAVADGFRRSVDSGLFVPEALSRERQVWTRDEWKLLDRVSKLCESRGLRLHLECAHERCQQTPLKKVRLPQDGAVALRCDHMDRVFTRL